MKKLVSIVMAMLMAALICGCSQSTINVTNEAETDPAGNVYYAPTTAETTKFEPITHEYVIPEGATGPADVTLHGDEYSNYPSDKQPETLEDYVQVMYYWIGKDGIQSDFDIVMGKECTAENLTEVLVNDGVLIEGTELLSFEVNGTEGIAEFNLLTGVYEEATIEQVAEAIADTFCENLDLEQVSVKWVDDVYGPFVY